MRYGRMVGVMLVAMLLTAPLGAQETSGNPDPDIQIRYGETETRYEYRVNGELVEIKIVPKVGPPYYLIPSENQDAWVRSETSRLVLPTWKILEW